jgi:transposase
MLMLPSGIKIYVSSEATSMNLSFDGLSQLVKEVLEKDPLSGHLFVFFNKRLDKVKILYWDRNGFSIWYKRLERGIFRMPRIQSKVFSLTVSELSLLLEGIDLTEKRRFSSVEITR